MGVNADRITDKKYDIDLMKFFTMDKTILC